jgi:hypothetical protein
MSKSEAESFSSLKEKSSESYLSFAKTIKSDSTKLLGCYPCNLSLCTGEEREFILYSSIYEYKAKKSLSAKVKSVSSPSSSSSSISTVGC